MLAMDYALNGEMISSGRDKRVKLWKPDLTLKKDLGAFPVMVTEVALSHDAKRAFFSDWNGEHPGLTLEHLLSMTSNGIPGTRFFYNPVAFSWTSRPMAERAGTSFSDLIQARIFTPARMSRSARVHRALSLRPDLAASLAQPYRLNGAGSAMESSYPQPQGDGAGGGTISTAADMAAFDIALDSGRLISAAARKRMWTPFAPELPYGLGWYVKRFRGEQLVWHTGLWEEHYSALYLKVPAKRWSMILLANSDGLTWPSRFDEANIEDSLFAQAFLDWLG